MITIVNKSHIEIGHNKSNPKSKIFVTSYEEENIWHWYVSCEE